MRLIQPSLASPERKSNGFKADISAGNTSAEGNHCLAGCEGPMDATGGIFRAGVA
jgi:hypothetical protein